MRNKYHESVLTREVLKNLGLDAPLKKQARFIDATIGTGGHALAILKANGSVLGIDADKRILKIAEKRLKDACPTLNQEIQSSFKLANGNFRNIDKISKKENFDQVDGILFDLGVSNLHLKSQTRGFSFEIESANLDMRIDPETQGVTAADLLNGLRKDQLIELFSQVMILPKARKLANQIILTREDSLINKTADFLEIVKKARINGGKLHPATLPFLALRIAVNSELDNLEEALPKAFSLLKKGGRLVVISFHSEEDVLVKRFFKSEQKKGLAKIITEKPITPSGEEITKNPRARSAKLRCLEKI
jgi:16S rRNA (cytosine1402-N4)-methyltransferase